MEPCASQIDYKKIYSSRAASHRQQLSGSHVVRALAAIANGSSMEQF
jgi:hypothetical protein